MEVERTSTKSILGFLGVFVSSGGVDSSCGDSCPNWLVLVSGVAYIDASEVSLQVPMLSELVVSALVRLGVRPARTRCFDESLPLLCGGASIFGNNADILVSSILGENPMADCRFPISLLLLLVPAVAKAAFVESLPVAP